MQHHFHSDEGYCDGYQDWGALEGEGLCLVWKVTWNEPLREILI